MDKNCLVILTTEVYDEDHVLIVHETREVIGFVCGPNAIDDAKAKVRELSRADDISFSSWTSDDYIVFLEDDLATLACRAGIPAHLIFDGSMILHEAVVVEYKHDDVYGITETRLRYSIFEYRCS